MFLSHQSKDVVVTLSYQGRKCYSLLPLLFSFIVFGCTIYFTSKGEIALKRTFNLKLLDFPKGMKMLKECLAGDLHEVAMFTISCYGLFERTID
jgi:hypothetical protein